MSPRSTADQARRTREAIVAGAVARASVEGLEGMTIGTLAAELGLSKAGVIGPFGSKEGLQLAAFAAAMDDFRRRVWDPAAERPAGRARLEAICEHWLAYLSGGCPPGGCFMTTASVEWDARSGPVHEAVARDQRRWLRVLAAEAEVAVRARELPAGTDPDQVAFELNGIAMSLNQQLRLQGEEAAIGRARAAIARVLAAPAQL